MCRLTGGGNERYRMINPAITNNASREITRTVRGSGKSSLYVKLRNNVLTNTLSAIGSRKLPTFDDCPRQVLAIQPSN